MKGISSIFFIIGVVMLQIFLSKKRNKWFGLVLPSITFIFSIIAVLRIVAFTSGTVTRSITNLETGEVITETVERTENKQIGDTPSLIGTSIAVFVIYNIPTVILLVIYKACREKNKNKLDIDKMNIQDLE